MYDVYVIILFFSKDGNFREEACFEDRNDSSEVIRVFGNDHDLLELWIKLSGYHGEVYQRQSFQGLKVYSETGERRHTHFLVFQPNYFRYYRGKAFISVIPKGDIELFRKLLSPIFLYRACWVLTRGKVGQPSFFDFCS